MKKKKVAVFSGGWGGEFLHETLSGIIELARAEKTDIFSFVNFSVRGNEAPTNDGETNIFRLPDISDFDGVLLFANTFNRQWEIDYLTNSIKKSNVPCISIEYPIDGIPCISTDNTSGMKELVEHMIVEHGCRDILYISGPKDHPEASERLAAFKEVMDAKGVPYSDGNIAYGDWSKLFIPRIIHGWVESRGKYPEAIICANDIMAIAVCSYLREQKVSIPDEVKVTGYDGIRLAQTLTPPIASVNHEWKKMGSTALESLLALMRGEEQDMNILLKTKFVPNGSCGCMVNALIPNEFNKSVKAIEDNLIEPIDLDSHFRHFYAAVRKADNPVTTTNGFMYMFEREHILEGDEFKLCLVPEFFASRENDSSLPIIGYSDEMDMACFIADGQRYDKKKLSLKECIYESSERLRTPGFYIFLPLYSEGRTFGFAMLSGPLNAANENQYYIWSRHMINALEQVRSNIKLAVLWDALEKQSITDQLTGVYNRHGCEQYVYQDMISFGKEDGESVLFLVDVDKMKYINDRLGHAKGDFSLKLAVQAMKEAIPEELTISRFGGDEFLIAGRTEALEQSPEEIISSIENKLNELVEKTGEGIPLTVSIGYSLCKPKDIGDIEKTIVIADENMYSTKQIHHDESQW